MDGSNAVEIPVQVKLGVFSTMNSYVIYVNYRLQVKRNYFYIESTRCFFFQFGQISIHLENCIEFKC